MKTYLFQNNQSLHDIRDGNVLLVFELGSFAVAQQHGCALCLPTGDGLGATSLADNIHCLTNTDVDNQRLEVFIQSDQESGVDGGNEEVKEVVRVAEDE